MSSSLYLGLGSLLLILGLIILRSRRRQQLQFWRTYKLLAILAAHRGSLQRSELHSLSGFPGRAFTAALRLAIGRRWVQEPQPGSEAYIILTAIGRRRFEEPSTQTALKRWITR